MVENKENIPSNKNTEGLHELMRDQELVSCTKLSDATKAAVKPLKIDLVSEALLFF